MKQASEGIREGDVVRPTLLPGGRGPRWTWVASLVFGGVLIGFFLSEIMARLILPAPPNPWRDPPVIYITDPEIGYLHLLTRDYLGLGQGRDGSRRDPLRS